MRLGKRNFRHKRRYSIQPYFTKRGDRIPDPYSYMMNRVCGDVSQPNRTSVSDYKIEKLTRQHKVKYLYKYSSEYRRVNRTLLPNGLLISTVCLMLNHAFRDHQVPVIFETMVFAPDSEYSDMYSRRYCRLSEARKGHREVIVKYRNYKLKPQGNLE